MAISIGDSWISEGDYIKSPFQIKRDINKLGMGDLEQLTEMLLNDPRFLEAMRKVKLKKLEE